VVYKYYEFALISKFYYFKSLRKNKINELNKKKIMN
jgi:hypothetical protein